MYPEGNSCDNANRQSSIGNRLPVTQHDVLGIVKLKVITFAVKFHGIAVIKLFFRRTLSIAININTNAAPFEKAIWILSLKGKCIIGLSSDILQFVKKEIYHCMNCPLPNESLYLIGISDEPFVVK